MIPLRPLTPNFEEDIFINYAHLDNQTSILSNSGWVDGMHALLLERLSVLMGEQPKIWRDVVMGGNDELTPTIVLRLAKTAFLVSVISPSFVKSVWCKKEINEFYRRAAENGGIKINNKSRIFKVVKTPIEDKELLEASDLSPRLRELLQESLGYEFYEFDKISGRPTEYSLLGQENQTKFLKKLEDLALGIKAFIKCQQSSASKPAECETSIYLAETTPELSEQRAEIKRELELHGYHVLPDRNLPAEGSAFEKEVTGYLKQAVLSIHLIGTDYSTISANDEFSKRQERDRMHKLLADRVRLQHELAMERGIDDEKYSRIIWMPEQLEPEEPIYSDFVNFLRNDPGVYEGAEVLCGSKSEDLKTVIQKKLKIQNVAPTPPQERKRIYLICEKQDAEAVTELASHLEAKNYQVTIPFKQGAGTSTNHTENQRLCDAVLIFYGNTTPYSIQMKLIEIRKNEVLRDKPLLAKGIYVSGPETEQKKNFDSAEAMVMKNFQDISADSINPFLEHLERNIVLTRTAKGGAA